ncbi:hypothetical protein DFH09DRAFT_868972, partial [Mycena vulgaris]
DAPDAGSMVLFAPPPQIESLTDGFRVLTRAAPQEILANAQPMHRDAPPDHNTRLSIHVGGATRRNDEGRITAGGGLWYNNDPGQSTALRLPEDQPQTAVGAEAAAAFAGLTQTVVVTTSKRATHLALTKKLQSLEGRGWIGVAEKEPLRALAAELQAR